MRILYIAALITITALCMQEEQQPNQHIISCCDGEKEFSPKQWNLLYNNSKLLQHAAEFSEEHHAVDLPSIDTHTLADILELLDDQGTYPIDNINRIDALLQGASYINLAPKKGLPLVVHFKQLISSLDIRNEQIKHILQPHDAWQHIKILNDPAYLIFYANMLTYHANAISSSLALIYLPVSPKNKINYCTFRITLLITHQTLSRNNV